MKENSKRGEGDGLLIHWPFYKEKKKLKVRERNGMDNPTIILIPVTTSVQTNLHLDEAIRTSRAVGIKKSDIKRVTIR